KVNLFVPAAYGRLGEQPHYLSDNPDWVARVNQLPRTNYQINFHGMFHRRHPTDSVFHAGHPVSQNDEWQYFNTPQARNIFGMMRAEFDRAGLTYGARPMIFRPPGWKVSREACRALGQRQVVVAGDDRYKRSHTSAVQWINYNWDMTDPCPWKRDDVRAFGHTSEWTNNYMNEERYNLIIDVLTSRNFHFKFLGE
ncbi:MAG: DUF2334 domain-containing protein, partial [Deltaproteobacteria bacterium]|nr:DUF2334 domain-containing protein [Deltaproteobacteria bacterium]